VTSSTGRQVAAPRQEGSDLLSSRRAFASELIYCCKMILIPTVGPRNRVKIIGKAHLRLVTPATVKRTVTPRRPPNGKLRTREYLTEAEVERLIAAAKGNRYGHCDATMALVAYRHGL
jgi:hypothetical protein